MENSIIIENLLANTKGRNVRFYDTLNIDELGQTMCAFLNGHGGDVLFGIGNDDKQTCIKRDWKNKIQNETINKLIPSAPISSNIIEYKGKEVLLISIWPGARKPYNFKGKIYVVDYDSIKIASPRDLKSLRSDRKIFEFHWERQVVLGTSIEELDHQDIKKTIREYLKKQSDVDNMSVEDFLLRLGLIKGGNLTNATIILFANDPIKYLPQSKIRVTVFNTSKSGKIILFDRVYNGNLFRNIQSIWDFYDTQLRRGERISGLIRRKEVLPLVALREGLLNAIIHRDYSKIYSTVNVEIYPDKVVISNTGNLPETMSIRDLKKDHDSILRNPDIAYICQIRGLIEMLGTGTLRMISDCKENDYPLPIWRSIGDRLQLTLNSIGHRISNDGISDGISDGINKIIDDGISDGIISGVSDEVRTEIVRIIELLEKEALNTDSIVKILKNKSKPTIERYLRLARILNMIEFKGALKSGRYFLTETMKRKVSKMKF